MAKVAAVANWLGKRTRGYRAMSSRLVPLKTRIRVGTLNLSRTQTSSRWLVQYLVTHNPYRRFSELLPRRNFDTKFGAILVVRSSYRQVRIVSVERKIVLYFDLEFEI
ncbi:hypothetical protein TNCV_222221 [Trichonephila clavipes]|nr:hypothetical protein TNCV_222221 [Trichonephila clavipes]